MSALRTFADCPELSAPTKEVLARQGLVTCTPVQQEVLPLFCANKVRVGGACALPRPLTRICCTPAMRAAARAHTPLAPETPLTTPFPPTGCSCGREHRLRQDAGLRAAHRGAHPQAGGPHAQAPGACKRACMPVRTCMHAWGGLRVPGAACMSFPARAAARVRACAWGATTLNTP